MSTFRSTTRSHHASAADDPIRRGPERRPDRRRELAPALRPHALAPRLLAAPAAPRGAGRARLANRQSLGDRPDADGHLRAPLEREARDDDAPAARADGGARDAADRDLDGRA